MKKGTILFAVLALHVLFVSGKNKNPKDSLQNNALRYQEIIDSSRCQRGLFSIYENKGDYYFEIPDSLIKRDFLIVNRILKVPYELNDAGINKGINYKNTLIRFEIDKSSNRLFIRNVRPKPHHPESDFIAHSVHENFISPLMGFLKIDAYKPDSSAVLVKVNDLYNGTSTLFNNLYKNISIGGNINKDLSRITKARAYDNNIAVVSELSTKVDEGHASVFLTVESVSSLVLLPEKPMTGRFLSPRVGYFTVPYTFYSDNQNNVDKKELITRWRLEPKDKAAYLRGELVEPKKPIEFYLD